MGGSSMIEPNSFNFTMKWQGTLLGNTHQRGGKAYFEGKYT